MIELLPLYADDDEEVVAWLACATEQERIEALLYSLAHDRRTLVQYIVISDGMRSTLREHFTPSEFRRLRPHQRLWAAVRGVCTYEAAKDTFIGHLLTAPQSKATVHMAQRLPVTPDQMTEIAVDLLIPERFSATARLSIHMAVALGAGGLDLLRASIARGSVEAGRAVLERANLTDDEIQLALQGAPPEFARHIGKVATANKERSRFMAAISSLNAQSQHASDG